MSTAGASESSGSSSGALRRKCEIRNQYGVHARPAALFVKTANKFASNVSVETKGLTVSGKSIMGLLTLECHQGEVITLVADGPDADEALDALQSLIDAKFHED